MHLGYGGKEAARACEAGLIACLRSQERDLEGLYLLGDVFDEYIEYRHLVPKGFVRLQALLAGLTDRGIPVTYLIGNHDPWHRDYFETELGVRVVFTPLLEPLHNVNVYMAHGDGIDATARLYNRLKPWLRHPVPVWLYRTLLPGDAGFALARWFNRRSGHGPVKPSTVEALRVHARRVLAETEAAAVIMGHSHYPEHCTWPQGQYLNLGSWYESHTVGRLDHNGLALLRWNGSCLEAATPTGAG